MLFPDPVTRALDNERREFFFNGNFYETENIITFTYNPPVEDKKLSDMIFTGDATKKSLAEYALDEFRQKLSEFGNLASTIFRLEPLGSVEKIDKDGKVYYEDEFLRYVKLALTGRNHPVQIPQVAMYLDQFIGSYEFWHGVTPKIDDKYIGIVAIDGFPQQSYPNILDALASLSLNYRWHTRHIPLDRWEAEKHLDKLHRKWSQKAVGILGQIIPNFQKYDRHALEMVNQIEEAKADVNSGELAYGYYTNNIILLNEDPEELERQKKQVQRVIESMGFNARIETINAVEAFLGSLPGHCVQNIRKSLISTANLADFMPISAMWSGDRRHPSDKFPPGSPPLAYTVTTGSTPFRLNLHYHDIGHTLIFGPTGAGKSTLLAFIAAQFRRYRGARIYAFDKGMSLYPLTKAAGGDHYEIGGDHSTLAFAPLAGLKERSDKVWAESFIITLLELQGVTPAPDQKKMIHEAMDLHVEQSSKSLTEYISNLQDEQLRRALEHYTINGPMGHLLDAEEDQIDLSAFSTFEIEELMNMKDEDAIPVLLYLFHKIERSLDGSPTMLILDEAWLMLGHPVFRDKIREWLKVLRKANCQVVMATQSLSDAARSGIIDALQENCPIKIMLPNPQAFNKGTESIPGPYDFYKQFGFNDREIEIIANAIMKREYYYASPNGARLFDLALSPFALAFVGSSSKESIKQIKELTETYKNNWVYEWVRRKGLDPDLYFTRETL